MSFSAFFCRPAVGKGLAIKFLHPPGCAVSLQQAANLTSVKSMEGHGFIKPLESKPWPYLERPYNSFYQFFDRTTKRMWENSKVIVVDGPLGVGKSAVAKNIANEFDLKYIPDVKDHDVFRSGSGFDTKQLDNQLPLQSRRCDFAEFYSQSVPKKQLSRIAMTQYELYHDRFFRYAFALSHLLNTGQGVVIDRGVHSDIVFGKTMAKFNHISNASLKFFQLARSTIIDELNRPHVYIYIDATVSYMQEQIKKRNIPWEVNSPVLTEAFLTELNNNYKQCLEEKIREGQSEILVYDAAHLPDLEMIVEDLEKLDLDYHESHLEGFSDKFTDWGKMMEEDDWNMYRIALASGDYFKECFNLLEFPYKAKELFFDGVDELVPYEEIVLSHPEASPCLHTYIPPELK